MVKDILYSDTRKWNSEPLDWKFAQQELLKEQGIDLNEEMQKKLVMIESQYRREKDELEMKMLTQTKVSDDIVEEWFMEQHTDSP